MLTETYKAVFAKAAVKLRFQERLPITGKNRVLAEKTEAEEEPAEMCFLPKL